MMTAALVKTDLSQAIHVTQSQLDMMSGDSETLIPEHLQRPAHWPVFGGPSQGPDVVTTHAEAGRNRSPAETDLGAHVAYLLRQANLTGETAGATAAHLERIVGFHRETAGNHVDPDIAVFEDLAAILRRAQTAAQDADQSRLEQEIDALRKTVAELTKKLAHLQRDLAEARDDAAARKSAPPSGAPSPVRLFVENFAISFGKTAGVATATGLGAGVSLVVTGGLDYLLHALEPQMMDTLMEQMPRTPIIDV